MTNNFNPISKIICVIILCAAPFCKSFAQDSLLFNENAAILSESFVSNETITQSESKINPWRVAIISSAVPITVGGLYVYLQNAWWADKRVPFHFTDDVSYALNLDKAGHFMSSVLVSTAFADLYTLAGIKRKNALWFGAGTSIACATIVEIRDALAPYWGFSKYDELANILGSLYPVLQEKVPFFQSFNFKWSYSFSKPSHYMSLPENKNSIFLDDYERQNFWFTIDVARLFFPNQNHQKFPYFFDLAFGVSARGLNGADNPSKTTGYREYFIGVDLNLEKLNFTNTKVERYVRKYLNLYHLPMPNVRVKPNAKAYIVNW